MKRVAWWGLLCLVAALQGVATVGTFGVGLGVATVAYHLVGDATGFALHSLFSDYYLHGDLSDAAAHGLCILFAVAAAGLSLSLLALGCRGFIVGHEAIDAIWPHCKLGSREVTYRVENGGSVAAAAMAVRRSAEEFTERP
ncbi:hypothetical protein QEG98_42050 (plasmid) [Myxococcus sp. MxC21-1]|uniref:hypothetical protein n=1 Tax=Myxococcus sp. MxC21-1 TaxID=3041439 RepID=UPI00293130DF|nr:hypothetical protein [Myxococcus sp. MxC21-1]WNZ66204.1 hypothetical protein QEG98_42050 [Myxococcus sp. MxC21-1]